MRVLIVLLCFFWFHAKATNVLYVESSENVFKYRNPFFENVDNNSLINLRTIAEQAISVKWFFVKENYDSFGKNYLIKMNENNRLSCQRNLAVIKVTEDPFFEKGYLALKACLEDFFSLTKGYAGLIEKAKSSETISELLDNFSKSKKLALIEYKIGVILRTLDKSAKAKGKVQFTKKLSNEFTLVSPFFENTPSRFGHNLKLILRQHTLFQNDLSTIELRILDEFSIAKAFLLAKEHKNTLQTNYQLLKKPEDLSIKKLVTKFGIYVDNSHQLAEKIFNKFSSFDSNENEPLKLQRAILFFNQAQLKKEVGGRDLEDVCNMLDTVLRHFETLTPSVISK